MDRNSIFYKARRFGQVVAYHILPHKLLSKIYYRILIHEKLNLKNPKTLNEKMQWLKLYDQNPLHTQMVDKYLLVTSLVNFYIVNVNLYLIKNIKITLFY